jgi:3-oxoacyl-[acyl-carrier-protein] synthase II
MRAALRRAKLAPDDVGYVNAHGTSTELNDRVEALAIREVLGQGVPVSSTKSMTGHLLGAAGALESVVCVKALETGLAPPTANLDDPDPECALDHVAGAPRRLAARVALNNSFGFGGHNASLVFTAPS